MTAPGPSSLAVLLRALKLPSFVQHSEEFAEQATREGWSHSTYLRRLVGKRPVLPWCPVVGWTSTSGA